MLRDFCAIDFETANNQPSSVCSVGIVLVRDGKIVGREYRLIRPEPDYYQSFCTRVHGLTTADTQAAAPFPVVWAELSPLIGDLPLVAHNARFDAGCLRAACRVYGMDVPESVFFCTLTAARRAFRNELPNHRLPTVAARCGYDLTQHHHALADAEACAVIALQLL